MVVRGLADFRQPELPIEHRLRNSLGAVPHVGFANDVGDIVAGERELAGVVPVLVLVDHTAHGGGIETGEGAVEYNLRHRDLAAYSFAARFEVDGVSEALLGF